MIGHCEVIFHVARRAETLANGVENRVGHAVAGCFSWAQMQNHQRYSGGMLQVNRAMMVARSWASQESMFRGAEPSLKAILPCSQQVDVGKRKGACKGDGSSA